MLRFKLKLAFRNLLKNKMYSILIIGGFSIGFTAFMFIGIFYNAEHNIDTGFKNYETIFRLYDAKKSDSNLDYNLNTPLSEKYPEIINTCPMEYLSGFKIFIKDSETKKSTQIDHMITTNNDFFDIFSVKVITSLTDKPFSELNSVVITEDIAKKLYGDKNPLGHIIKTEFFSGVISAVIKDLPTNSSFKGQLFLNSENKEFQMSQACNNGNCIYPTSHFLLLKSTTNIKQFTKKLNKSIRQFNTNVDSLALQPLPSIYLSNLKFASDMHEKGSSKVLIIFLSIGILIILLSSINFINYTISMKYAKMKEIGINKINGAAQWQLILDSFLETTISILFSALISIVLVTLFLPYTSAVFGREITISDLNLLQLIPLFVLTILAIIIISSILPIYILSKFNIVTFLNKGRTVKGKQLGVRAMSIFQLTVSVALISVVIVIFKQLEYVKHYDLGFDEEHLIKIDIPYLHSNPSLIKNEIAQLSFVKGSTLSDGTPGGIKLFMGSGEKENQFMINCIYVSDDYINTMGMELAKGRDFFKSDKNKACILNKKAIDQFGWTDIENKKYTTNGNEEDGYNVIGIVNNFNVKSLHSSIDPVALIYDPNHRFDALTLNLSSGNVGQQLSEIEKRWKKLLPDEPFSFQFYDDIFQSMYLKEQKLGNSIALFSLIAVILTCMGILAQIFLICLNKTKEIGIRKVNGASIFEVMTMLNRGFVQWVLMAFLIATPIAYYVTYKWLQSFAFKTHLDWWIFILSGVLIMTITLITVSWQSFKAANMNPVKALQNE